MEIKELVRRINFFRNKANLSARELSLRINKHDTYISKLENKQFSLSLSTFFDILTVLEVTPEEFFSSNYQTYKDRLEAEKLISNMTDEKIKSLIDFLK